MHYFYNLSSASGDFASRPLICPALKKILRAPMLSRTSGHPELWLLSPRLTQTYRQLSTSNILYTISSASRAEKKTITVTQMTKRKLKPGWKVLHHSVENIRNLSPNISLIFKPMQFLNSSLTAHFWLLCSVQIRKLCQLNTRVNSKMNQNSKFSLVITVYE